MPLLERLVLYVEIAFGDRNRLEGVGLGGCPNLSMLEIQLYLNKDEVASLVPGLIVGLLSATDRAGSVF